MSYEAFREQCAKTIELYDNAMMAHDDYVLDPSECAGIIRALPLPEVTDNGAIKSKLVANMIRYTCATKRQAKAIVDGCFDGDSVINISDLEDARNPYAEIEALRKENEQLRELLCLRSSSSTHLPYMDDGELQDNSAFPHIDYKRDSVAEIISKLQQRTLKELKGGAK